jgi:hypothetical protein
MTAVASGRLVRLTCLTLLSCASSAPAQTGPHGYVVSGGASQKRYYTPDAGPNLLAFYEHHPLIGGGFAWPLLRDRVWVAGDWTSRISGPYLDASGGPSLVVGMGRARLQPFAHGGYRAADGGGAWNVGAGAHVWTGPRLGLRVEYQYQWRVSRYLFSNQARSERLVTDRHMVRGGLVFR